MKEQVLIFRRELELPTSVQRKKKLRERERDSEKGRIGIFSTQKG